MHEFSIASGIIAAVIPEARKRNARVSKIWVKAGVLRAIMPDALIFSFDVLKKEHNSLDSSEILLEIVPLTGKCRSCQREFEINDIIGICPDCGSADVAWSSGNELYVEKIEILTDDETGHNMEL